jgi:UDP-N-acetyl-D-mannosaminuronate dehydrogenase
MQSGIDYFEVKESANSQPHSNLHSPGIYVGGHCIPVYPHLYEVSFPNNPFLGLIKSARNINNLIHKSIIDFVLSEVKLRGIKVEKCLILGAAYRGDVKETYDSGVFPIIDYLKNNGIGCVVYDPLFSSEELVDFGLTPVQNTLSETQLVIINSDHRTFMNLRSKDFSKGSIVIDGRNILRPSNFLAGQLFTIGIGWNR